MYDYYKGFLIREGTTGIDGAKLRELYEAVGWCNSSLPNWKNDTKRDDNMGVLVSVLKWE